MEKLVKKFKDFLKKENSIPGYIEKFLNENGYSIVDIYDAENVTNHISAIKLNGVLPKYLYEGIDFELDNPGGVIIFLTDLNSTLGDPKTFSEKVKFFFESKFKTFLNRFNIQNRLHTILLDKHALSGYTLGQNFKGSYKSKNGANYTENSFTIDLAGISSDLLVLIASEICREFKQKSVMVRDFNPSREFKQKSVKGRNFNTISSSRVYFVNDKEYIQK